MKRRLTVAVIAATSTLLAAVTPVAVAEESTPLQSGSTTSFLSSDVRGNESANGSEENADGSSLSSTTSDERESTDPEAPATGSSLSSKLPYVGHEDGICHPETTEEKRKEILENAYGNPGNPCTFNTGLGRFLVAPPEEAVIALEVIQAVVGVLTFLTSVAAPLAINLLGQEQVRQFLAQFGIRL